MQDSSNNILPDSNNIFEQFVQNARTTHKNIKTIEALIWLQEKYPPKNKNDQQNYQTAKKRFKALKNLFEQLFYLDQHIGNYLDMNLKVKIASLENQEELLQPNAFVIKGDQEIPNMTKITELILIDPFGNQSNITDEKKINEIQKKVKLDFSEINRITPENKDAVLTTSALRKKLYKIREYFYKHPTIHKDNIGKIPCKLAQRAAYMDVSLQTNNPKQKDTFEKIHEDLKNALLPQTITHLQKTVKNYLNLIEAKIFILDLYKIPENSLQYLYKYLAASRELLADSLKDLNPAKEINTTAIKETLEMVQNIEEREKNININKIIDEFLTEKQKERQIQRADNLTAQAAAAFEIKRHYFSIENQITPELARLFEELETAGKENIENTTQQNNFIKKTLFSLYCSLHEKYVEAVEDINQKLKIIHTFKKHFPKETRMGVKELLSALRKKLHPEGSELEEIKVEYFSSSLINAQCILFVLNLSSKLNPALEELINQNQNKAEIDTAISKKITPTTSSASEKNSLKTTTELYQELDIQNNRKALDEKRPFEERSYQEKTEIKIREHRETISQLNNILPSYQKMHKEGRDDKCLYESAKTEIAYFEAFLTFYEKKRESAMRGNSCIKKLLTELEGRFSTHLSELAQKLLSDDLHVLDTYQNTRKEILEKNEVLKKSIQEKHACLKEKIKTAKKCLGNLEALEKKGLTEYTALRSYITDQLDTTQAILLFAEKDEKAIIPELTTNPFENEKILEKIKNDELKHYNNFLTNLEMHISNAQQIIAQENPQFYYDGIKENFDKIKKIFSIAGTHTNEIFRDGSGEEKLEFSALFQKIKDCGIELSIPDEEFYGTKRNIIDTDYIKNFTNKNKLNLQDTNNTLEELKHELTRLVRIRFEQKVDAAIRQLNAKIKTPSPDFLENGKYAEFLEEYKKYLNIEIKELTQIKNSLDTAHLSTIPRIKTADEILETVREKINSAYEISQAVKKVNTKINELKTTNKTAYQKLQEEMVALTRQAPDLSAASSLIKSLNNLLVEKEEEDFFKDPSRLNDIDDEISEDESKTTPPEITLAFKIEGSKIILTKIEKSNLTNTENTSEEHHTIDKNEKETNKSGTAAPKVPSAASTVNSKQILAPHHEKKSQDTDTNKPLAALTTKKTTQSSIPAADKEKNNRLPNLNQIEAKKEIINLKPSLENRQNNSTKAPPEINSQSVSLEREASNNGSNKLAKPEQDNHIKNPRQPKATLTKETGSKVQTPAENIQKPSIDTKSKAGILGTSENTDHTANKNINPEAETNQTETSEKAQEIAPEASQHSSDKKNDSVNTSRIHKPKIENDNSEQKESNKTDEEEENWDDDSDEDWDKSESDPEEDEYWDKDAIDTSISPKPNIEVPLATNIKDNISVSEDWDKSEEEEENWDDDSENEQNNGNDNKDWDSDSEQESIPQHTSIKNSVKNADNNNTSSNQSRKNKHKKTRILQNNTTPKINNPTSSQILKSLAEASPVPVLLKAKDKTPLQVLQKAAVQYNKSNKNSKISENILHSKNLDIFLSAIKNLNNSAINTHLRYYCSFHELLIFIEADITESKEFKNKLEKNLKSYFKGTDKNITPRTLINKLPQSEYTQKLNSIIDTFPSISRQNPEIAAQIKKLAPPELPPVQLKHRSPLKVLQDAATHYNYFHENSKISQDDITLPCVDNFLLKINQSNNTAIKTHLENYVICHDLLIFTESRTSNKIQDTEAQTKFKQALKTLLAAYFNNQNSDTPAMLLQYALRNSKQASSPEASAIIENPPPLGLKQSQPLEAHHIPITFFSTRKEEPNTQLPNIQKPPQTGSQKPTAPTTLPEKKSEITPINTINQKLETALKNQTEIKKELEEKKFLRFGQTGYQENIQTLIADTQEKIEQIQKLQAFITTNQHTLAKSTEEEILNRIRLEKSNPDLNPKIMTTVHSIDASTFWKNPNNSSILSLGQYLTMLDTQKIADMQANSKNYRGFGKNN